MSIPKVSIRQVKAARELLGWSQEDLAAKSGISIPTIKRLEARDGELGGREELRHGVVAALQTAGVEFTNRDQPGVKLKAGYKPPPAVKQEFTPFGGEPGIQTLVGPQRRPKPRDNHE